MAAANDFSCSFCTRLQQHDNAVCDTFFFFYYYYFKPLNCSLGFLWYCQECCCHYRALANEVSSCNEKTQPGSTLVQDTDHGDQNLDRALAQFHSNDDDYSELFGKCGYFNIESINKTLFYKNKDDLFIIHFNIRSLQKNVETLNNYLS